jgi:hypothetical protein
VRCSKSEIDKACVNQEIHTTWSNEPYVESTFTFSRKFYLAFDLSSPFSPVAVYNNSGMCHFSDLFLS